MNIVKKKNTRKPRSLVTQRLEKVSKDVFRKYNKQITDLVGSSPGIYALYDENELYYVGKSTDLKKRVKQHLKDRHLASWSHFSLYLVRNAEHIHEIESLLVRISNPKGNRVVPKGKSSGELLRKLKTMVKQKQKEDFDTMFGAKAAKKKKGNSQTGRTLEGLVSKRTLLYHTYKGKDHTAHLLPNGTVKYANKTYTSLSGAAKAVVNRNANGWSFWYIKDLNGDWVRVKDYIA